MNAEKRNGRWVTTYAPEEIKREALFGNVTPNGVVFKDELSGPDGAAFILFVSPHTTNAMLEQAKQWLRLHRDVTGWIKAYPETDND